MLPQTCLGSPGKWVGLPVSIWGWGSSSSPSLVPRKGLGALSVSKHGEGGVPPQVPGRVCRKDCPRGLFVRYGWEECGFDGKGFMTLGFIHIHQAPSQDPGPYHSWHGVLVWMGRGLLGGPHHPWSLVSYTLPSLGLCSVCGNTARNLWKSIS